MSGTQFTADISSIDEVLQAAEQYGDNALKVINDTLHREAGDIARPQIQKLIPMSGRKWSGKRTAARSANPFAADDTSTMLAVTIHTRAAYNYLYFPDDGSTTRRHAGNQQFFKRGGENALPQIIELCLGRLAEEFGGD